MTIYRLLPPFADYAINIENQKLFKGTDDNLILVEPAGVTSLTTAPGTIPYYKIQPFAHINIHFDVLVRSYCSKKVIEPTAPKPGVTTPVSPNEIKSFVKDESTGAMTPTRYNCLLPFNNYVIDVGNKVVYTTKHPQYKNTLYPMSKVKGGKYRLTKALSKEKVNIDFETLAKQYNSKSVTFLPLYDCITAKAVPCVTPVTKAPEKVKVVGGAVLKSIVSDVDALTKNALEAIDNAAETKSRFQQLTNYKRYVYDTKTEQLYSIKAYELNPIKQNGTPNEYYWTVTSTSSYRTERLTKNNVIKMVAENKTTDFNIKEAFKDTPIHWVVLHESKLYRQAYRTELEANEKAIELTEATGEVCSIYKLVSKTSIEPRKAVVVKQ